MTSNSTKNPKWHVTVAGVTVEAPSWARYAARQPDGAWYWFEEQPNLYLEGSRQEWGWYSDSGKAARVFKNKPSDWMDAFMMRPYLIAPTEEDRKTRILRNAAARYQATLGKIVVVQSGCLIGVVKDGWTEWVKARSDTLVEVIETPENEYLRFKNDKTAPYWRGMPANGTDLQPAHLDCDFVLIRPPRESVTGVKVPSAETSFTQGGDRIVEPTRCSANRVQLYLERHLQVSITEKPGSVINDSDPLISEIVWAE